MIKFGWRRSGSLTLLMALWVTLLLPMGACQSAAPFDAPDVSVVDFQLTDATLLETAAIVTVRIANGNPDPIVINGGSYELSLGGTRIGRGLSANRVEIPRYESATDEVALHVSNLRLFSRLNRLLNSGHVSYRLAGKVSVEHPLGQRRVRVEREGAFDLADPR